MTIYEAVPITTSNQLLLLIFPWFPLVLATAVTVARFWARKVKSNPYGADDWLCLVALVIAYAIQCCNVVNVVYGGNTLPFETLGINQWSVFFQVIGTELLLWMTGVSVLQICILCFYLRIFSVKRAFRISCIVVGAIILAWWIASFFVVLFECNPPYKAWTPWVDGTCVNQTAMCSATGIIHIVLDFVVLILPLPVIWSLQMASSHKLTISVVLSTGIVATVCSILRMDCMISLIKFNPEDPTGTEWLPILFQIIELSAGVFCVSIPTLQPLGSKVSSSWLGSIGRRLLTGSKGSRGSGDRSGHSDPSQPTSGKGWSQNGAPTPAAERSTKDRPYIALGSRGGKQSASDEVLLEEVRPGRDRM